ncbi:MAG TPA: vWA domain-containing protein [Polyangiaceae bacterium]|nr:vWA domain-containing protein [Polyangiaceae bacterium]
MSAMRNSSLYSVFLSLTALCATSGAVIAACSSADEATSTSRATGGSGKGSGGSDNGTTTGGAGGSTGGVGAVGGSGGAGGGVIDPGKGMADGGPMTCGGDKYNAEQRPLDMYVMFDDSGSMIPWWISATQAFTQFLNAPESAGLGVGLQFFGTSCDVATYSTPKVPIAVLPGSAPAITAAFPLLPVESTPTEPALRGAVAYARTWQTAHADHKVVVLLVTDGEPTECNSTVPSVTQVAAEGFSGTPSIPTYVLGLGLSLTNLHSIAMAGGTNQAFIVDPNSGTALAAAMNQIRGSALPCDYALPKNTTDPRKVNIDFTPQGGTTTRLIYVGDAASCDPVKGGWYYDNPQTPSRLIVRKQTCDTFKKDPNGRVDVVLGCDIVIK